jgi:acetyl esterase
LDCRFDSERGCRTNAFASTPGAYLMKLITNHVSARMRVFSLGILLFVLSCSESPELEKNNDPRKHRVARDVLWASPTEFDLTMDIYTPRSGKDSYPVVVMFHGGGWLINDKSIMDQSARYLATNSEYVICNVNYRLLSDNGNTITLDQIVGDAFGAILWVKDDIDRYQGDPTQIAVTGDSAGGHLSAMIVNMGGRLSSGGLSDEPPGFVPSYLPDGMSAEQVALEKGLEVQAAILSYGAFDVYEAALGGFEGVMNPFWLMSGSVARGLIGHEHNVEDDPDLYRALSPIHHIPLSTERELPPQLLTVGSDDTVVTPASVRDYADKLRSAGHAARYWEHEGRPHAFLDSGSNAFLGIRFEDDAPTALDVMIQFLDDVFDR